MRIKYFVEIFIVLVFCSLPLFLHIDSQTLRQWDEARNAVHTVEMLQDHNYLVRTFNGIPETWEPKPPLLIWLQLASVKLFGLNELALRLPSVLAAFMTAILLILYFARFLNSRFTGYIAALILVTSQGYVDRHIARTGDHDALLILFSTAIILHFYQLIISDKPRPLQFLGLCFLFILGVFTKSVAALFILPGLIISVFIFKAGKKVFFNKWFYLSFLIFICVTGSYYVAREFIQPGYLNAVWHWELFPRYANTENNFDSGIFWYYAINFFKLRYTYWIWFLLTSVIMLPFLLRGPLKSFYWYIVLNTGLIFIVLSFGSKGLWYDGPLFPLFAIIISVFIESVLNKLMDKVSNIQDWIIRWITVIILLAIMFIPYYAIIKKVTRTGEYPWDKEYFSMAYILRDSIMLESLPDPLKVVFEGYDAHLLFYVKAVNYQKKSERLVSGNFSTIRTGDDIIISQQQVMDSITARFNYRIIEEQEPVKVIRILEEKI